MPVARRPTEMPGHMLVGLGVFLAYQAAQAAPTWRRAAADSSPSNWRNRVRHTDSMLAARRAVGLDACAWPTSWGRSRRGQRKAARLVEAGSPDHVSRVRALSSGG